jgi:hypothetical protein
MESHSKNALEISLQLLISPSAFFQNISYVSQKVPTLYTVMSTGENATNPAVYGEFSNSFVLGHNQINEIVVNNHGKSLLRFFHDLD